MKEVLIDFDNKSPSNLNEDINIAAFLSAKDDIEYKFIEGLDGVWTPIRDFEKNNICTWRPKRPGKYMIMVQGKSSNCKNFYDYLGRAEYEIIENKNLIKEVNVDKYKVVVGEKVNIDVVVEEELVLYRFWIKGKQDWEILRDYTTEKSFVFTAKESGNVEILIECKKVSSDKNVDDFTTIKIQVKNLDEIEIKNFSCLTNAMLINEELVFRVEATYSDNRPLLYKFLRISKDGKVTCVQDFSSKSIVSFKENEAGEYKLLCLVRDMFSTKQYDDRALIHYKVEPYNEVRIRKFTTDLASPQAAKNFINLKAEVTGGRELLYRYIIEGPISDDSGYIRREEFAWQPKEEGKYKLTLKAKDISYKEDYEDIAYIYYEIYKKGEKPVRITGITCDKGRKCLVDKPVNIKVKTEGGRKVLHKFTIYKNGVEKEAIDYCNNNWVDFIPTEPGEYEVEIKVKDEFSAKEYDSSSSIYIEAKDYVSADIEYVLLNSREYYLVGDIINIEAIMKNTKDTLVKFVTKINTHEVENTGFIEEKALRVKPKCPGKYTFVIYAKNKKSPEEFDSKKEVTIYVHDVSPVNETNLKSSSDKVKIGEDITFEVTSKGGKDVCYEFYIMINGDWVLAQSYSRKNYYTFLPFKEGKYRVLALSKSFYKNIAYEDYSTIEFEVV